MLRNTAIQEEENIEESSFVFSESE